jgi:tetratricopeptide (TPR) repeat protein
MFQTREYVTNKLATSSLFDIIATLPSKEMQMKSTAMWKTLVFASVVLSLSACGQSATQTDTTPGASQVSAEQADWKGLTLAAETALKSGDKATAESKYKEAALVAEQLGADNPAQAEAVANLASFYYVQGDANQANQLYKKSLALHEKALGMEHTDLVKDLVGLAKISSSSNDYATSAAYYERAMSILKKAGQTVPADIEAGYADVKKAIASK